MRTTQHSSKLRPKPFRPKNHPANHNAGLGFAMANVYWYGFHMPRTNARDSYYAKLEQQKAEARGQKA
ncbi:Cytochrome c oxidase subunit COX9 [Colletotrichum tofieldiae]|uniref:Cytochrome c oxidase subunit 7A n=1 Tax=Colletotrichum liriopes TaxID=708192 RepID=A0AA37GQG4_9PEZI|nr:cytochrome c oxidase subunit 7A [Colletotrichum liriopes]GKT60833.1 cytochrome c oxidase subunit COX9 [Colletotrichum tofieldiae]GKT68527.1 Cytochrome c oxidase subunit COX9 [Colletotrichum tofieldiae]GKT90446.1 cytochrome C oxidase subunit COX9 [Colletotrichum tofieldiae]